MTDFIITMLMITLLNVLLGSAAFILLMLFIKRAEEKKKSKFASELKPEQINIREYSESIEYYLSFAESILPTPIIESKVNAVYAKTKNKHGFNRHRSHMKVRVNRHSATDYSLADILVRNYQQTANDFGAHNAPLEFHRLTVPCG